MTTILDAPISEEIMPAEVKEYVKACGDWIIIDMNHCSYGTPDGEDEEEGWVVTKYSFLRGMIQSKEFFIYHAAGERIVRTDLREVPLEEARVWLKVIDRIHERGVA
jgi:hypothetical protein